MPTKEDIDRLRLKTGQLVTEDWFDDLGDVLEEIALKGAISAEGIVTKPLIPYEYSVLGDEEHHFTAAYIDEIHADEIQANDAKIERNLEAGTIQAVQVNAETGNFTVDVFVNGKKVIKDEDPIYIQEFLSPADYQLYDRFFSALKAAILELEPILIEPYVTMVELAKTTAPLAANGEYDSGWKNCEGWSVITGVIFSDTDGVLYVEQSGDGTESDYTEVVSIAANKRIGIKFELLAKYVRVRFVNSDTAQNKFRLFTYLKRGV